MTGIVWIHGAAGLCEPGPMTAGEAGMLDRLIDLVLALEPFEIKQQAPGGAGAPDAAGEVTAADPPSPTLLAESTERMLTQMRAVLDREAGRLGAEGTEGKAAVDQVALIARTLEKIDQMERLIAQDRASAARQTLSPDERAQLRQTVRQLILAAAERLAADRAGEQAGPAGKR
ncbi:hypothetical protein [Hoeflea ulvae]|uniref:Uncharacterized protein n=1 Tax=Hoeflea ulvae TaxID=2983764 RepID=A0ABT3YEV3_9HYPH|nr:hypothetical protein [Hoeflea ulvae]MCY0094433.1 hypothetical protein [Hoeflea ulvae]